MSLFARAPEVDGPLSYLLPTPLPDFPRYVPAGMPHFSERCASESYDCEPHHMEIALEQDGVSWQRISSASSNKGRRTMTLPPWSIMHVRKLEFSDLFETADFEKRCGSIVRLRITLQGYELIDPFDLFVDVGKSSSTTKSPTRQGSAKSIIPGLPMSHPACRKVFRITVIQESNMRAPDGTYCWGRNTVIRNITVEPENSFQRTQLSDTVLERLVFADNEIPEEQRSENVLQEEALLMAEVSEEDVLTAETGDQDVDEQQSDTESDLPYTSDSDSTDASESDSTISAKAKFVSLLHSFRITPRQMWTDGCTCGDWNYCVFCKGHISGYERFETVEGIDDPFPPYDETGQGALDQILEGAQGWTADGERWLSAGDTGDPNQALPLYWEESVDFANFWRRLRNLEWLYPNDNVLPQLREDIGLLQDGHGRDISDYSFEMRDGHWKNLINLRFSVEDDLEGVEEYTARLLRRRDFENEKGMWSTTHERVAVLLRLVVGVPPHDADNLIPGLRQMMRGLSDAFIKMITNARLPLLSEGQNRLNTPSACIEQVRRFYELSARVNGIISSNMSRLLRRVPWIRDADVLRPATGHSAYSMTGRGIYDHAVVEDFDAIIRLLRNTGIPATFYRSLRRKYDLLKRARQMYDRVQEEVDESMASRQWSAAIQAQVVNLGISLLHDANKMRQVGDQGSPSSPEMDARLSVTEDRYHERLVHAFMRSPLSVQRAEEILREIFSFANECYWTRLDPALVVAGSVTHQRRADIEEALRRAEEAARVHDERIEGLMSFLDYRRTGSANIWRHRVVHILASIDRARPMQLRSRRTMAFRFHRALVSAVWPYDAARPPEQAPEVLSRVYESEGGSGRIERTSVSTENEGRVRVMRLFFTDGSVYEDDNDTMMRLAGS